MERPATRRLSDAKAARLEPITTLLLSSGRGANHACWSPCIALSRVVGSTCMQLSTKSLAEAASGLLLQKGCLKLGGVSRTCAYRSPSPGRSCGSSPTRRT